MRVPVASVLALLFAGMAVSHVAAENWPSWRGPTGQGISTETGLPLRWSFTENVRWKLPLPGPGNSTPVVWEDTVFLTQATDGGRKRWTYSVHRTSGEVLWKRAVPYAETEPTHETNPYCSASPATDGERVVVSHGSAGVFAYDFEGQELWRRDLGAFRHIWGNASSPVIHGDLCFLNCGPGARTFLIALDKKTGATKWQVDIPGGHEGTGGRETWTGSWSTPLLVRGEERDVLLMSYPERLLAFELRTGKELWSAGGLGKLVYTSPLAAGEIAVAMSGFMGPPLAVRLGGSGDVTESHRLWREETAQQRVGSGVIHEGFVYIHNDPGTIECLELRTGRRVWRERLGSRSWSSIVLAEGRLYTADDAGNCAVLRAAPEFEVLARNALGERIRASIAVSGGALFIRTYAHLWCIGAKNGA